MAKTKQQSVLSFFKKTPVKDTKAAVKSGPKSGAKSNGKTSTSASTTPVTPESVSKSTKAVDLADSRPPPKFDSAGNVPTPSSEFEEGSDNHSSPVKRVSTNRREREMVARNGCVSCANKRKSCLQAVCVYHSVLRQTSCVFAGGSTYRFGYSLSSL